MTPAIESAKVALLAKALALKEAWAERLMDRDSQIVSQQEEIALLMKAADASGGG